MWVQRLRRIIEKNRCEVEGIGLRKYPAFVLSDRATDLNSIPAFEFHEVSERSLEPLLQYLSDNEYVTLTADEYVERRGRSQGREVLLTFDDGRKSLYNVAYPALKQFGFKAVAYIVPGMAPGDDTLNSSEPLRSLCSWREIREMHESGTIDIQSHSMYHHSIAVSERVIDFFHPGMDVDFTSSDLAPLIEEGGRTRKPHEIAYGTPIHGWAARFSAAPAFRESPAVIADCVEYVDRQGGADYFLTSDWQRLLKTVLVASRRRNPGKGFETAEERRKAILGDLMDSKRELERRLAGKTVRHFAYPWSRGSPLSLQLSAEAGYVSNAWGSVLPKFVSQVQSPVPIARLASLYIWRLPGRGRRSILEVLQSRWSQIISKANRGRGSGYNS